MRRNAGQELWAASAEEIPGLLYPSEKDGLVLHRHFEVAALHAVCDPVRYEFTETEGGFLRGTAWVRTDRRHRGWVYAVTRPRSGLILKDDKRGRYTVNQPCRPRRVEEVAWEEIRRLWDVYLMIKRTSWKDDFAL